jgi:hypothetical protein
MKKSAPQSSKQQEVSYTIELEGQGAEIVYGTVSQDQFRFWTKKQSLRELGFKTCQKALDAYFYNPGGFEDKVPKEAKFKGYWFDLSDILHNFGVTMDSSIRIVNDAGNSETIVDMRLSDFIEEKNIATDIEDAEVAGEYIFYGKRAAVGQFFSGRVTIEEGKKFELKNLKLHIVRYPNGDTLLKEVYYDLTEIDGWTGEYDPLEPEYRISHGKI